MIFTNNSSRMRSPEDNKRSNSSRNLSLLGASLAVSILAGCASVDKKGSQQPVVADNEKAVVEQVQPAVEPVQEVDTAKADKLMATLKAPLVEPGTAEPAKEPEPSQKTEDTKQEKTMMPAAEPKVEAKVEEKVVEKKEVVKAKKKEESKVAVKPVKKETAKKLTKASGAVPLSVSKKDLPASYDIWVLKEGETSLTQGLVISTPTWEMGKEGYTSQIWLTLKEDEVHINSSSDIATEVGGLGIRIDGGDLIPYTRIAENNIGIVEGEWLDKLANAKSLDIHLAFFPGKKPTSDNFKSSTSLDNLDRVVATYRKLNK